MGKLIDRQSKALLRMNPELTAEEINRAVTKRESSDELANLVRDAFSKAFSAENLKMLTARTDDETFLNAYPRMTKIGEFAAESEALAVMSAKYLSKDELETFITLTYVC